MWQRIGEVGAGLGKELPLEGLGCLTVSVTDAVRPGYVSRFSIPLLGEAVCRCFNRKTKVEIFANILCLSISVCRKDLRKHSISGSSGREQSKSVLADWKYWHCLLMNIHPSRRTPSLSHCEMPPRQKSNASQPCPLPLVFGRQTNWETVLDEPRPAGPAPLSTTRRRHL